MLVLRCIFLVGAFLSVAACEAQRSSYEGFSSGTLAPKFVTVEKFNDANFMREVQFSVRPVVVDCGAPWCGPCRSMAPVVEDLAADYGGTVRFGKLDITTSPRVARQYAVSALPAFLIFKNGRVVQRVIGAQSKQNLKNMIDAAVR